MNYLNWCRFSCMNVFILLCTILWSNHQSYLFYMLIEITIINNKLVWSHEFKTKLKLNFLSAQLMNIYTKIYSMNKEIMLIKRNNSCWFYLKICIDSTMNGQHRYTSKCPWIKHKFLIKTGPLRDVCHLTVYFFYVHLWSLFSTHKFHPFANIATASRSMN